MTRRRLVWVGVAVCLALAEGTTASLLDRPPPGVNRASFDRLRQGMTLAEVQAALGVPPRTVIGDGKVALYSEGTAEISVYLDERGRVTEFTFYDDFGPSLRDRLRGWLGW